MLPAHYFNIGLADKKTRAREHDEPGPCAEDANERANRACRSWRGAIGLQQPNGLQEKNSFRRL
jgi:hypothetical protein